jgi:hypothetical protein
MGFISDAGFLEVLRAGKLLQPIWDVCGNTRMQDDRKPLSATD